MCRTIAKAPHMARMVTRRVGDTFLLSGRKCSAMCATTARATMIRTQISRKLRFSFAVSNSSFKGYHLKHKIRPEKLSGRENKRTSSVRIFFHPDCTVGAGISPARRCVQRSRTCQRLTAGREFHPALKISVFCWVENMILLVEQIVKVLFFCYNKTPTSCHVSPPALPESRAGFLP